MNTASGIVAFSLAALALLPAAAGDDGKSFAHLVPAGSGLFVEISQADDLLLSLTDPQVWAALADFVGQPAREGEVSEWRERIENTVKMDPAEAIHLLFARQVAFVGYGPGRAQDAVVLCRPAAEAKTPELLKLWAAEEQAARGATRLYLLPGNVGLAIHNGTFLFGDAGPAGETFDHVVDVAAGVNRSRLADDADFKGLLKRVPAKPDGVFFMRLGKAAPLLMPVSGPPSSQPSVVETLKPAMPELPGPFRRAANVMLALHREKNLLHFTAVGDGRKDVIEARRGLRDKAAALPARTLFVWAAHLDYARLIAAAERLPPRNLLRMVLTVQRRPKVVDQLIGALGTATCVSVGVAASQSAAEGTKPPLPAVGVVIEAKQPAAGFEALSNLAGAFRSLYNLVALGETLRTGSDVPALPEVRVVDVDGVSARVLDLSTFARNVAEPGTIDELHLAWAVDGDVLIIASHTDWLRQLVEARRKKIARLESVLKLSRQAIAEGTDTIVVAQLGPISDLGRLWLTHLRKTTPAMFAEDFWRRRQPGGGRVRLGVSAEDGKKDKKRLVVTAVDPKGPSAGSLQVDDEIIGCNGRLFATTQPASEFRSGIFNRPDGRWLDVWIMRDGKTIARRIPLPFVNPIQLLQRAVAAGKIVQRVVYHDDVPHKAGQRGFLTCELRRTQKPLFEFPQPRQPQPVGAGGERP